MRRVLFVTPDLKAGGVQRALIALLKTAPKDSMEITVRVFTSGGELEAELPSGVKLETAEDISAFEGARSRIASFLKKAGLHRTFNFAKSVYHRIGDRLTPHASGNAEYDFAIAFSDGLATWYTANNIEAERKIAFVHTDLRAAGYNQSTEEKAYATFETIYCSSEAARRSFDSLLPVYANRTRIMYVSVNTESVRHSALEESEADMNCNELRIATVGRLSSEKGCEKIPVLLKMLNDDNIDATWYVVGDGAEKENLLRQARKLGVADKLVLTGALKNPYAVMSRCDIYVQPSNYEGYCIALAEARALCLPCVCCDFSGAREQLHNGEDGFITGMLVDELYPPVKELAESEKLRVKFSTALRNAGENATEDAYSAFWTQLF